MTSTMTIKKWGHKNRVYCSSRWNQTITSSSQPLNQPTLTSLSILYYCARKYCFIGIFSYSCIFFWYHMATSNIFYIFPVIKLHENMHLFDRAAALSHCLKESLTSSRPKWFDKIWCCTVSSVVPWARAQFPHHFLQREQEIHVSSTQQEEEEERQEISWKMLYLSSVSFNHSQNKFSFVVVNITVFYSDRFFNSYLIYLFQD